MQPLRVRELTNDEGNRLLRIVRRGDGSVVTWRRAQVVLWSAQGMAVPQIAPLAFTSEDRVREVIDNFNDDGSPSRRVSSSTTSRSRSAASTVVARGGS